MESFDNRFTSQVDFKSTLIYIERIFLCGNLNEFLMNKCKVTLLKSLAYI
jgi:hypothetical protein